MRKNSGEVGFEGFVVVVIILIFLVLIGSCTLTITQGAGIWGPTRELKGVEIVRTYVDYSGRGDSQESHYMVATVSNGIFEVANGLLLGIWNADELYGQMVPGKCYDLTTEGNRVVTWYAQSYPYITRATPSTPSTEQIERK